jgi:hypothetical protein
MQGNQKEVEIKLLRNLTPEKGFVNFNFLTTIK